MPVTHEILCEGMASIIFTGDCVAVATFFAASDGRIDENSGSVESQRGTKEREATCTASNVRCGMRMNVLQWQLRDVSRSAISSDSP